ncbi:hypothetical protein PUN28_002550 [Cardiocondyla obscurior]|uniref:Uncharacterized protein n=1 Tax=Cardiocondyla obscurior TaxID=286306 RepID=A0AAW2GUQ0_9HYME
MIILRQINFLISGRLNSKVRAEKEETMRRKNLAARFARWHANNSTGRTDDSRSLDRCTRWRSTETLATSLVTRTFAKSLTTIEEVVSLPIKKKEKKKKYIVDDS